MLVLGVKNGDRILVTVGGVECWVTFVEGDSAGRGARLVFDAPRDLVRVVREEVLRRRERDAAKAGEGGRP